MRRDAVGRPGTMPLGLAQYGQRSSISQSIVPPGLAWAIRMAHAAQRFCWRCGGGARIQDPSFLCLASLFRIKLIRRGLCNEKE